MRELGSWNVGQQELELLFKALMVPAFHIMEYSIDSGAEAFETTRVHFYRLFKQFHALFSDQS